MSWHKAHQSDWKAMTLILLVVGGCMGLILWIVSWAAKPW